MGDIVNGTQGIYGKKGCQGRKEKQGKKRIKVRKIIKERREKGKENKTIGKRNINGAPAYFFPISSEKNKEQEKKKRERK